MADIPRIKVVFLGAPASGCCSLLITKYTPPFPEEYVPTVGADLFEITESANGQSAHFTIWRMRGQDDYARLRPNAYPDTDFFVLVFSVVSRSGFEAVRATYVPEIRAHMRPGAAFMIMGLCTDLRTDEQTIAKLTERGLTPVTSEEGAALAEAVGATGYVECSAKRGQGMEEAFAGMYSEAYLAKKSTKDGKAKCALM